MTELREEAERLAAGPAPTLGNCLLGAAAERVGRPGEALRAYRRALAVEPDMPVVKDRVVALEALGGQ